MARPSARDNRFFWELIIAFVFIVTAAVFQTFHFFNNAWLIQREGTVEYQRGLGDDCVKSDAFDGGIKCSEWGIAENTFVINGHGINPEDVEPPSAGLKGARTLFFISTFLYIVVIFALSIVCVRKRDLRMQQILCAASVVLILLNFIIIIILLTASFTKFLKNKGECSFGSAFYYFLFSNVLLWLGSASHFDSWKDIYESIRAANRQSLDPRPSSEMNVIGEADERRPSFLNL